ncbi:MAG: glycosyltransferase, partial [Candidatus Limivivens sp.]|nr:glycosyltransferase [Candidatus Limivivens sp.]
MENQEIKISVIIPIYNMEKYVGECLDTVISQNLKEIEIMCINDGSTDHSEEIVKEYMKKDDRIRLISQENQGVAKSRNRGLREAKGNYVAFMDPDDWYPDRDVLRILYDKVLESGAMICGGSFSEQVGDRLVTEFTGAKKKYAFQKDEIIKYSDYQFDYGYHRFIYNLEFLKENNIFFPPYIRFQDPPFFVKAMITAGQFYAIRRITYRYRVGTQTIVWTNQKLIDLLRGLRDVLRLSGSHQLKELHCLTLRRFGKNYLDRYAKALAEAPFEFLDALKEFEEEIDPRLIEDDSELVSYSKVLYQILQRSFLLCSENERNEDLLRQIHELKRENRMLKASMFEEPDAEEAGPKVSVIIPVYNVEKYIEECLESVRNQSLKQIEIILVNDGTKDDSMEVVSRQIREDARIKVVNKENGGLSSARNAGLREAAGEYVLFLDSDDLLRWDALQVLYWKAKREQLDDLFYNAESFYDEDGSQNSHQNYADYYKRKGSYDGVWSGQQMFITFLENQDFKPSACLQLLKRSFLEDNRITFYEGILHEDNLFTLQCLLNAERAAYLDMAFYLRRVHQDSIMTTQKGIRNSFGYFIGIWGMIASVKDYTGEFAPGYLDALSDQLLVMCNVASGFIKGMSEGEVEDFSRRLPAGERYAYKLLVGNVALLKQQIDDDRKAARERKKIVDNLVQTVNRKKTEANELKKEKNSLEEDLETLETKTKQLEAERDKLIKEFKKEKENLTRQNRALKKQIADYQTSFSYRVG